MAKDLGAAGITSLQNLPVSFSEIIFLLKVSSHKTSLDSKDAFPPIFEFQVEPCLVIEVR